jgi:hypothetical protein
MSDIFDNTPQTNRVKPRVKSVLTKAYLTVGMRLNPESGIDIFL